MARRWRKMWVIRNRAGHFLSQRRVWHKEFRLAKVYSTEQALLRSLEAVRKMDHTAYASACEVTLLEIL